MAASSSPNRTRGSFAIRWVATVQDSAANPNVVFLGFRYILPGLATEMKGSIFGAEIDSRSNESGLSGARFEEREASLLEMWSGNQ